MNIEEVSIKQFRGFHDQKFTLGEHITLIAGRNGTQKTTLLGILSQPFSLRIHPDESFRNESPLCGGNYISGFSEKFRLSPNYDKPGEHEWTMKIRGEESITFESISRSGSNIIRFYKKGDHKAGSGYYQYPVIYLSLKRLLPIGEDKDLKENNDVTLTKKEIEEYKKLHKKILLSTDVIQTAEHLASRNKDTMAVNTDYYDWSQNSAGQDNLGKIILALFSFQRLKDNYPQLYKGGLLVIDELDATMYPGSQEKLLEVLRKYASKLNIQIIFTTHSKILLKKAYEMRAKMNKRPETEGQIQILFLQKKDQDVQISDNVTYNDMKNILDVNVTKEEDEKIIVYTEDEETRLFFNALRHRAGGHLKLDKTTCPCTVLIDLSKRKSLPFHFPNSIVVLDGDVRNDEKNIEKLQNSQNVILLPSNQSPERLLAEFLSDLSAYDDFWKKVNRTYDKEFCFKNFTIEEINKDRLKAKNWFKEQRKISTKWLTLAVKKWIDLNQEEYTSFIDSYKQVYNKVAKKRDIETI